jgi:serine/threonine protein phosphatase PrpC
MLFSHSLTDIGRKRTLNEDSIFAANGLYLVCDGMGGHKAGEIASKAAVDTVVRFIERSDQDPELTWPYGFNPRLSFNANRLRTAVKLANRTVYRNANSSEEYTGMGTTVAAALFSTTKTVMTYANVGDSRIYLIRGGVIMQLTRDDSLANVVWPDQVSDAPPTANPMVKHVLTKALGAREDVEFEVVDQPISPGDVLLLCSDGLTNMVPDARICQIVSSFASDVASACSGLVSEANAQGGRDNISVILVQHSS